MTDHCHYCKIPFGKGWKSRTIDHIVPKSKGGTDTDDNKVPCCALCNRQKGSKSKERFLQQLPELIKWRQKFQDFLVK